LPVHVWYPMLSSLLGSTLPIHLLSTTPGYLMRGYLRSVYGIRARSSNREVGLTYALGDEDTDQQAGNEEDNDEDDDDTRLTLSPVLTLGQLGHGELATSGNEVGDGGHFVGCGVLQQRQSDTSGTR
jgi:hypothetical protein